MEKLLQVGVITSTHGLKGEMKVFPTTDDPLRFKELKTVLLGTEKDYIPVTVERVKFFKQFVILKLKDFDRIEDVENFRRKSLFVTREQAVPLEDNEYFIADLIGMEVFLEDGSAFGKIRDVLQTGANDVYVIDSYEHGEVLLPAIHQCVIAVNVEEEKMVIHLLDGLIGE